MSAQSIAIPATGAIASAELFLRLKPDGCESLADGLANARRLILDVIDASREREAAYQAYTKTGFPIHGFFCPDPAVAIYFAAEERFQLAVAAMRGGAE